MVDDLWTFWSVPWKVWLSQIVWLLDIVLVVILIKQVSTRPPYVEWFKNLCFCHLQLSEVGNFVDFCEGFDVIVLISQSLRFIIIVVAPFAFKSW